MIILLINRDAGYNFVRYMDRAHGLVIREEALISDSGEPLVALHLTPSELNIFRAILETRPDQFENAAVILRGIGSYANM